MLKLNEITLPAGLRWADKYDWTPVHQSLEISLTGTVLIEEAAQLAGRPITLVGGADACWLPRAELDVLRALTLTAGLELTLDLGPDGIHTVIWSRDGQPIEARPLVDYTDPVDDTIYVIDKMKFMSI